MGNIIPGGDFMKKFILGFITAAILFTAIPVGAVIINYTLQSTQAKIVVDGEEFSNKDLPVMSYKGYNYLPAATFREICNKIGVGFVWDNATKEIRITTQIYNRNVEEKGLQEKESDNVSEVTKTEYKGYNAVVKDGITYVSYEIFRYAEEYMLFLEGEEKNVKIIRKGNPDIECIISADEYLLLDLKIYIPLSIVNELGL